MCAAVGWREGLMEPLIIEHDLIDVYVIRCHGVARMKRSGIRGNSGYTPDSGLTACIRATDNRSHNQVTLNNV